MAGGERVSLCEWDPVRSEPAAEVSAYQRTGSRIERVLVERHGCPNEAAIILGHDGQWRLCADCAELPHFRRYRVASVLVLDIKLRRDLVGWWVDGDALPERPRPLAEVLKGIEAEMGYAP